MNNEVNDRFSPLIKSDEVLIYLRKNDTDNIDFSVMISDVPLEDAKKEADLKLLTAIATGMITIASKQAQLMAQVGITTIEAAKDIQEALTPDPERIDVV